MQNALRTIILSLVALLIIWMLLSAVSSPMPPLKQLVPLPSLEIAPDYRRYPSISNVHC